MAEPLKGTRAQLPIPEEETNLNWAEGGKESFVAGMRRQNWALGFSSNTFSTINFKEEEGYDPFEDQANKGYPPQNFTRSRSQSESALIRFSIDREREDLKSINESSWGLVGEISGGMTQPNVALGAIIAPYSIPAMVATEATLEIGAETILHSQQETRTAQETALNVGAATAGTLILGGAAKWWSRRGNEQVTSADMEPVVGLPQEHREIPDSSTVGSAANVGDRSLDAITKLESLFGIGPMKRLLNSESMTARSVAQQLADSPYYTKGHRAGRAYEPSAEAYSNSAVGRAVSAVEEAQALKPKDMPLDEFDIKVARAMSNGDLDPNPAVEAAAKLYREKVLGPIYDDLVELGVMQPGKVKGAVSYFPRVYRADKIFAHWDVLKGQLVDHYRVISPDLDDLELEAAAVDTMNRMTGGVPQHFSSTKPGALKERSLDIEDALLEPYREMDASKIMLQHARSINPFIELNKRFDDVNLREVTDTIRDDYTRQINATESATTKRHLAKQRDEDLADIEQMRQRILNRVQRHDPNNMAHSIARKAGLYNVTTQLGGVVLSSGPDLAMPLMRYGLRSYTKGIVGAGRAFFTGNTMAKAQVSRMGVAIERTLNSRAAALADEMEPIGRAEALVQKWWPKLTLFQYWTDTMESISAHAAMDSVLRSARRVAKGKVLNRSERQRIARMGLNEDDLRLMDAHIKKTDDLWHMDTTIWNDPVLAQRVEAAIGSDVRRTIIRPGVGDKPRAMDDPFKALMFQYMTFAIAATNRLLVAGIQQRDLPLAIGMLSSVFLGSMVGASKAWLRGEDPTNWSEDKWVLEGIDRSGLLGVYSPALSAIQYGLGNTPSRYLERGAQATFGGATASQLGRAVRLGTSLAEGDTDRAAEDASRFVPFYSNTLHARQLWLKMSE